MRNSYLPNHDALGIDVITARLSWDSRTASYSNERIHLSNGFSDPNLLIELYSNQFDAQHCSRIDRLWCLFSNCGQREDRDRFMKQIVSMARLIESQIRYLNGRMR